MTSAPQLLTDPFLQLPSETSVRVVWFTEFVGSQHTVTYGENLAQTAVATTTKLSRTREDQNSEVANQTQYQKPIIRDIWRHEAEVTGLTFAVRVPYRVTSVREDGESVSNDVFTLAPLPKRGTPLKILLTSDHQIKPMVAANLQSCVEKVGRVDAVWFAGDLVNVSDRASEWFDDNRGGAFFPCLQGRANYKIDNTFYTGGQIIQHAPMFTCIGNHEVMGRANTESLNDEFDDTIPRTVAQKLYGEKSLKDNSFNTDTYEEIFTLPQSTEGGKTYYATSFGDVRLVVLYATNMWRTPNMDADAKSRYRERDADLKTSENWGYGQHIYEAIAKGSKQYNWLVQELENPEFQQAKYRAVMLHHPPHSLGGNVVPAYTDPVQIIERNDNIKSVRYEYPKDADYIIRDVIPLLEAAKVQLVFYGHSHLWNRFVSPSGMHFLETSNVGNSYGAHLGENKREVPIGYKEDYAEVGDPNNLEPIIPSIAPLLGEDGKRKPLPYIASNDITVFSIFDTEMGTISSYYFDTRKPDSEVVKFDEFNLK